MKPVFSVVIPTYNHAHFLERALESVINQSFTDWEIIIVDNHSQDNTDEIVQRIVDPRVQLFKINNNGVIAASRNKGIIEARGEWLAFLDSDDYWAVDKLQSCFDVINQDVDFLYHDLKVVGKKKSVFARNTDRTRQTKKNPLLDMLIQGNLIGNSSVVVRKDVIERAGRLDENPQMIGAEDFNAWLKIAMITDKFQYIPKFLGFYEYHAEGISRKDMSECYKIATVDFIDQLDHRQRDELNARIAYMKGRYLLLHGKLAESRKYFNQSLCHGNFEIKLKSCYSIVSLAATSSSE